MSNRLVECGHDKGSHRGWDCRFDRAWLRAVEACDLVKARLRPGSTRQSGFSRSLPGQWGCWLALILLLAAGAAQAEPVKLGYFLFCAEHPAYCTDTPGAALTLADLARVNLAVNRAIAFAQDQPTVRNIPEPTLVLDYWSISPVQGDCEDYAATKLAQLLKAGIGRRYLRFGMGTENGEYHGVLLADVDGTTYVLDSLTDDVTPLAQSAFTLVVQEKLTGAHPALRVVRP